MRRSPHGLDPAAHTHQYADMRTTIDIPDELYRALKTRAAIKGVSLRVLVRDLIEQALAKPSPDRDPSAQAAAALPVAIRGGNTMVTLSPEDIHRLEEEEDLERLAGSS